MKIEKFTSSDVTKTQKDKSCMISFICEILAFKALILMLQSYYH